MGAPGAPRASGAAPFTALACVLMVVISAAYVGVCSRGDLAMCPAWTATRRAATPAASICAAHAAGPQIIGLPRPFLPADALARGTAAYGSGERMARLGQKLLAGQPITVAFLGGSITWGRGALEGGSFVNRFTEWLQANFPHPGHVIINQGLPAVTSALFAACYDKVPASTDLVVLDFAVNDAHVPPGDRDKNGYSFGSSDRLAFEQLVRKSLKLEAQPAVALLHYFGWNSTRDKDEYPFGSPIGPSYFWRTIEDELSTIGAYYDVSALSLRNAVYQLMAEGRHGFQWNVSVHRHAELSEEAENALRDQQFYWDENHPWDRTGHRAMAELLMAAVSRGVQTVANGQQWQHAQVAQLLAGRRPDGAAAAAAGGRGAAMWPPLPPLPQPMMPGNFEANGSSCHLQEEFKDVIGIGLKGFKWEARAPKEQGFIAQKWALTARAPGASGSLRFDSDLGGLSAQGGNTTVQVHLLFLRSWQGMGRARVECASGCACEPVELDAHWEREATLTDLTTLQVTPHKKCLLSLEVLPGTSSGAHQFSVSGLVVSSLEAKMERGKIGQWEYHLGGEE